MTNLSFSLHPGQAKVYQDTTRFRTLCSGRRFGKSRLVLWELILASLTFPGKIDPLSPETVAGLMPSLNQAKKVLWIPLVNICTTDLAPLIKKINYSDFRIEFKDEKPPIIIGGVNDGNGDRLRGLRLLFAAMDEYADFKPYVFQDVIRPAMSDTQGSRALFTGTPKGRLNHMYQLKLLAETMPEENSFFNMPSYANPTFRYEEAVSAKKRMTTRAYRQEYLASFEDFPGKVFTELGSQNLTDVKPDRLDTVVMGVDWGSYHPAISILGLDKGSRTWYWLEGWSPGSERDAQPVPQPVFDMHIRRLAKKWSVDMTLCDPSQASSILHLRSLGKRDSHKGLINTREGYNRVAEGIEQVHSLISQQALVFVRGLADSVPDAIDGDLAYGLHESYHYELDKNGYVREKVPADGYMSHIVDGTRYALAIKNSA